MRGTESEGCRIGLCRGPRRRSELGRSHRGSFRHDRDMLFLNERLSDQSWKLNTYNYSTKRRKSTI